jgi:hypothetical protein
MAAAKEGYFANYDDFYDTQHIKYVLFSAPVVLKRLSPLHIWQSHI